MILYHIILAHMIPYYTPYFTLVGGLEHFLFFQKNGIILPIDLWFSRWLKPPPFPTFSDCRLAQVRSAAIQSRCSSIAPIIRSLASWNHFGRSSSVSRLLLRTQCETEQRRLWIWGCHFFRHHSNPEPFWTSKLESFSCHFRVIFVCIIQFFRGTKRLDHPLTSGSGQQHHWSQIPNCCTASLVLVIKKTWKMTMF